MIESIRMEEAQVEAKNIQVKLLTKEQISPDQKERLLKFFEEGYGERWISGDNFNEVMIPNATQALMIESDGRLAGALLFDHQRISDISVHPDFQGQGLGERLFEEAAKACSDAWISVGINAEGMLATVTSGNLHFLPVEEKQRIEVLFAQTNRGKDNFKVEVTRVALPILHERLANKGINKDQFTAFVRVGATHGVGYQQILFQNQSNSTS